ncbi:SIS domain-containing protein, partial [Candidatus Aerophobetes bacterium]|nr:SIS domain-containing protein [Candidatus Aerophobetes bacterium]
MMQLDDFNFLKSIDREKMHLILSNFPEQCKQSINIGKEESKKLLTGEKDSFEKIVVCGLGGSAIGGDILKTIFSESKIVIDVSRDYHLPSFVDEKTLVFAISYSGNTEETISSFKEAVERGCRVISISSGGELERLSREKEVAHIKIPSGFPPRCAIGFLTIPCLMLVEKITGINLTDTKELVEVLS